MKALVETLGVVYGISLAVCTVIWLLLEKL
jgi:hypothetical protein